MSDYTREELGAVLVSVREAWEGGGKEGRGGGEKRSVGGGGESFELPPAKRKRSNGSAVGVQESRWKPVDGMCSHKGLACV